ncbi:MAG: hydrogenase maturation protease [Ktedonobacterales bacterium]
MPAQVIGIGNEWRGDDGVGLVVAKAVRELHLPGVATSLHTGEGTSLLEAWQRSQRVILVDAAYSGATAGAIHRIEAHRDPLPYPLSPYSSHSFSLQQAIELSRILGSLPETLIVLAIEGQDFTAGAGLSTRVRAAVAPAVACVLAELDQDFGQLFF